MYTDDLLCCSPSLEQHLRDAREVLAILRKEKPFVKKPSKAYVKKPYVKKPYVKKAFGREELGFLASSCVLQVFLRPRGAGHQVCLQVCLRPAPAEPGFLRRRVSGAGVSADPREAGHATRMKASEQEVHALLHAAVA